MKPQTGQPRWRFGGQAACRGLIAVGLLAVTSPCALGLINRVFTPGVLARRESHLILVGSLRSTPDPDRWRLEDIQVLKGENAEPIVLDFSAFRKDQRENLRHLLAEQRNEPVMLFTDAKRTKGLIHVGGTWIDVRSKGDARWEATAFNLGMSSTYAGETRMLVRMVRHLLADPEADAPTSVGTAFSPGRLQVGKVEGAITGMEAVLLKGTHRPWIYVASPQGDRLFRPQTQGSGFDEATAGAGLRSASRRYTWMDFNQDGRLDLASWNGKAILVSFASGDGTFTAADPATAHPLAQECLGLHGCTLFPSRDPGLVVSTTEMPFLLARLKDGKWQKTNVPSPAGPTEAGESVSACIVADMDNDGLWDILQPRAEYGLLWKGTMQGLAVPTRVPISDPNGKSAFALGDFDQDGFLDVFACAPERTELWENDGKGGFRPVSRWAGSLSPKTPAGASIARAVDLNHDGRQDIALIYPDGSFMYHFNRGFRCFADEGEPKLPGTPEPQPVRACTVADLNGDGAEDLAIALGTGEVFCCLNECFVKAGLRVSLKPGTPGPVTLSVWPGGTRFPCLGAWPFGGSCPTVFLGFPRPGRYALNWDQPGKPKIGKEVDLTQESAGSIREIILGE